MSYQLWMSPDTGYRRQGTRFQSIHKVFSENLSVKNIFEPILCCKYSDSASDTKMALDKRDFDVTCVIGDKGEIIGQVFKKDLSTGEVRNHTKKISDGSIITESCSLPDLLNILTESEYKYVSREERIVGIVTRADFNKPIPRIYLFSIISLLELHLNFWVNFYHENDSWYELLSEERKNKISELHRHRTGSNKNLSYLDCAQLCDKKELLTNNSDFLERLKLRSKNKFKQLMERIEKIRNEVAHSQSSIISNLDMTKIASTIQQAEAFLKESDNLIEEDGKEKAKKFKGDSLVPVTIL